MEFKIGQRIECLDEYRGEVAFIGKLKGRDSVYVGIRLDKPVGKNSGMYAGDKYFIAGKNQGIFVKYEHLKELERTNRIIEENLSLVSRDVSKIGPLSLDKAAKILASHKDETMYMDISSLDTSFALENEEYSISKNVNEFLKGNKIDFLKNEKKKSEKKENKPLSKYDKAKEYYRLLKEKNKLKEMSEYLKEDTSLIENSDKTFEETLNINNTPNINNINSNNINNSINSNNINSENLKNNKIDTLKFYDQKEFHHQRPKEMEEEMKLFRDSKKSIETINDNMKSVQKDLEDAEKELREEIKKRKGLEEMVRNKVSLVLYNLKSTVRELKECFSQIKNYKLKEKGNLYFLLMNVVNSLEKKDVNSVNKNLEMFKKEVEKKGITV